MPMTGPAWQARESQRHRFTEALKDRIIRQMDDFECVDLIRMLHHSFEHYLHTAKTHEALETLVPRHLDDMLGVHRQKVVALVGQVVGEVMAFRRTTEEGNAIIADLFKFTTSRLALHHHAVLQSQQLNDPRAIYGTADVTAEISYE